MLLSSVNAHGLSRDVAGRVRAELSAGEILSCWRVGQATNPGRLAPVAPG